MALTVAEIDVAVQGIIETGQSFMVDGIQYSAANLGSLIKLRDSVQTDAGRTAKTRPLMRRCNINAMGYS